MNWDEQIAARTLWQEARGEPYEGQRAVAHVLLNRLKDGRWGKNLASVCLYPLQFSGWNAHDPNRRAVAALEDNDSELLSLLSILDHAQGEIDPTEGAMFYYAPAIVGEPSWAKDMIFCGKFGSQMFFKEKHRG